LSPAALPRPATLLPHSYDAVLLDEITLAADDRLTASLVVRPGTAFSAASGNLPGWIGPEILAEAISALSGYRSLNRHGRAAGIGLLLGVRGYTATAGEFHPGEKLDVEVVESSEDEEGRAVFDGVIRSGGQVVASGTLTVFQPADDSFLDRECARDE
jgi:predicted hotdog family 3-hydroxylacyl-ACP dehydratase